MTSGPDPRADWLSSAVLPHEPMLRGWLARKGLSIEDVDDVVQETYARLAALESFEHIKNARNYMFAAAHSLLVSRARRARVVSIAAVEDVEALGAWDDAPSPEVEVGDRQELQRLAQAIAQLTSRRREVFILRKIHDLPQREVAERLGLSQSAVETHLANALAELAKMMERVEIRPRRASRNQSAHGRPAVGGPRNDGR